MPIQRRHRAGFSPASRRQGRACPPQFPAVSPDAGIAGLIIALRGGGSQERGGACGAPAALRFLLCDAGAGWKAGLFRGCLALDGAVLPGTGRPLVLTPESDKIGNIHVYTTNPSCIYRTPPLFSYILFVKFNLF